MPWKEFSDTGKTLWSEYGSPVWSFLTDSYLPEMSRESTTGRLYDDFVRPFGSPLGALSATPLAGAAKRFGKYAARGIEATTPVAQAANAVKPGVLPTLRDEVKQLAMSFSIPGTAISKHGVALGAAHLKTTPLKDLPREAYETARMLWNPERAVGLNEKLTGGTNPFRVRQDIVDTLTQKFPQINPNDRQFKNVVENILDFYAQNGPGVKNSRFEDILNLERPTAIGGGGLKTSDVLAGTSKGSMSQRQILTHPVNVSIGGKKYNVNPASIQKEVADTPLFGEDYVNTYFKRKTALNELDRQRNLLSNAPKALPPKPQDQLIKAADFATKTMGGFGKEGKSAFNSDAAKWLLTAPDWTRRHFALANEQIQALRPKNWSNPDLAPYRRYAGYSAAGLGLTGAANYALNGQMPTRATDVFNIELPKNSDYATRDVFDPFTTEMDLPKTAFDILNNVGPQAGFYGPDTKGFGSITQPIRNRVHPFTRPLIESVYNVTFRGGRMTGEEPFSKPTSLGGGNVLYERPDIPQTEEARRLGQNAFSSINPQAFDALASYFGYNNIDPTTRKEKYSPLSKFSQIFELPFGSYTPKYSRIETPFERRMKKLESKYKKPR